MAAADFLNLSGRAGRLRKEFHGNVWCLRPQHWRSAPQDRTDLPEVVSALETTMLDGGTAVQKVLLGQIGADTDGAATAAVAHLLTEYVQTNRTPDFRINPDAKEELEKTLATLQGLDLLLPPDIIKRNSGILVTGRVASSACRRT